MLFAPCYNIHFTDWLGAVLWAALALEITFVFNYGDYYDWWSSPVICMVSLSAAVTLVFCLRRMFSIRPLFKKSL